MTDTKISGLTTTTALTGAELVPLVQNGTTVNASVATIAAQVPATGVTPGNYTNATLTINSKGQVVQAANGTAGGGGLVPANNLSDLTNVSTARTNLGLGTAALQNIAAFAQVSNNLSDLVSTSAARSNLGLPASATTDTTNAANISSGLLSAARGGLGVSGSSAANGVIPIGNGSGFTLATLTGGTNVTVTNSAGGITISASGGGATPGGSSGQVQVNSSGTLAGITVSGDGTLNTSTGALTVTKINGISPGSANGVATLNSGGTLTPSQIPAAITGGLNYQGLWNATTNSPSLASGTGTKGYLYKVSVAGTSTLDGISSWNVGDELYFDGSAWEKLDGQTSEVLSVAGRTGAVTLSAADIFAGGGTAGNGVIPIGNGTGFTLATLTAGTNVTLTNSSGGVTIAVPSIAPTGAAGGDLAGNFPNPTVPGLTGGTRGIYFTSDGNGQVLFTGVRGFIYIPYALVIRSMTLMADQVGSVVIDIWKAAYASFPPSSANSICASARPTLSGAQTVQDTTLTGWTTTIAAGTVLAYNIVSVSTITRVNMTLTVTAS